MTSSADLGVSPAQRWGTMHDVAPVDMSPNKRTDDVVIMTWHTDPPEWAAYVNNVLVVLRDAEVHVSIDMGCKRVDVDPVACENGRLAVCFHTDLSEDVKWPDDPGPWVHADRTPTLTITGLVLDGMEVVACGTGRYTTRIVCLRKVDWATDGREAQGEAQGPAESPS